jgi:hypothetical protein
MSHQRRINLEDLVTNTLDMMSDRDESYDEFERYLRMAKLAVSLLSSYAALSDNEAYVIVKNNRLQIPDDCVLIDLIYVNGQKAFYSGEGNMRLGNTNEETYCDGDIVFDIQDDSIVFHFNFANNLNGGKGKIQYRRWEQSSSGGIFVPESYTTPILYYFRKERALWKWETEGRGEGLYKTMERKWEIEAGRVIDEIEQPTGEQLEYIAKMFASKVPMNKRPIRIKAGGYNNHIPHNKGFGESDPKVKIKITYTDGTVETLNEGEFVITDGKVYVNGVTNGKTVKKTEYVD